MGVDGEGWVDEDKWVLIERGGRMKTTTSFLDDNEVFPRWNSFSLL